MLSEVESIMEEIKDLVLILVVMEYALWDSIFQEIKKTKNQES